jgi:hypothetical protein
MKLSKLIDQLNKAFTKYGEMDIGAYSRDYANDAESYRDIHDIKFRVVSEDTSSCLPGVSMEEEEHTEKGNADRFGVIFYLD